MGKVYQEITSELSDWLKKQPLFFVATAPLAEDGFINCSPKGMDTFRVLDGHSVAYLDLTGSGIETVAHLQENRRIVFMFCAFEGAPQIVRLHGEGTVVTSKDSDYAALRSLFPNFPGARAVIRVQVKRISDSCGYAVPFMDYIGERDTLIRGLSAKGEEKLIQYRGEKNATSITGLKGLRRPDQEFL